MDRVERGGAGIKIRIVKGANLAMERVEASWHGWAQAPYRTKAEVDAELSALGGKRKHARARAHQRGRSLYRVSRSGMLPLAGGMDALLSHASRVTRLQRLVREDLDELERLRKRGHKLRRSTAELGERLERNRLEIAQLTEAQRGLQRERQAASLFERAFAGNSGFTAPAAPDDRLQYGTLRVVGGGGSRGEKAAEGTAIQHVILLLRRLELRG